MEIAINLSAVLVALASIHYLYTHFGRKMFMIGEPPVDFWEILVPASGRQMDFSYEHHKAWDEFVKGISGGISIMKTIKGEWISQDGTLYRDRMIPVRIKCNREQIEKIIAFTIKHYEQEAVLAYRISDEIILTHKNELDVE
jgi:hypothetical protein